MAERASPVAAFAHWHILIEKLQASSLEFYKSVEEAVGRRQVPSGNSARVDWKEAGALSAKREYLRVTRGRHVLDICGAPFGSGFFVSWWLAEARPSPLGPTLGALGVFGVVSFLCRSIFGQTALPAALIILVGIFVLLGMRMAQGEYDWEPYLLAIPILGFFWSWLFVPATYYRIDTALMFQDAVHAAVLEVVDGITEAKGLRALTELERKPVMRDFYK